MRSDVAGEHRDVLLADVEMFGVDVGGLRRALRRLVAFGQRLEQRQAFRRRAQVPRGVGQRILRAGGAGDGQAERKQAKDWTAHVFIPAKDAIAWPIAWGAGNTEPGRSALAAFVVPERLAVTTGAGEHA